MSTAVTANKPLPVIPARFRNTPVNNRLGAGISSGYPIIRIRGKVFSVSLGKEEEHQVPPVLEIIEGKKVYFQRIDVVILRAPETTSRQYYEGYEGNQSKGKKPLCWSSDGKRPDADVPEPENPICQTCERNIPHPTRTGKMVRDCSNGKRLAVLPWPTWTEDLLGKPLLRPCLLRVPGASLPALKKYAEDLGRKGLPYHGLLTTITIDPTKEFPQLLFDYNSTVTIDDASADVIADFMESADSLAITGEAGGGMREVEHEEPVQEEAPRPKPAAVNLAQMVAASKKDAETGEEKAVQAEVLPPEPKVLQSKANGKGMGSKGPKVEVTHNGKPAENKVDNTGDYVEDAGDGVDEAFVNEVMGLLNK